MPFGLLELSDLTTDPYKLNLVFDFVLDLFFPDWAPGPHVFYRS